MKLQFTKAIACLVLIARAQASHAGAVLLLQNDFCSVTFDAASLQVSIKKTGQPAVAVSIAQTNLGPVAGLSTSDRNATWSYPDKKISITLTLDGPSLLAHVRADETGDFSFPIIPETDSAKAWILPLFEGVYAPCGDATWDSFLTRYGAMNTTADLTMPFVGLDCGDFTLTYIFTNAFNNQLEFEPAPGKTLQARFTHQFTRNHAVKEYGVAIQLGTNSPVAPASLYRQWLLQRGEFVSFKEKIQRTPEAAKLPGAAHIYLWGGELLHHTDVKNWKKLCQELIRQGETPVPSPAKRIWSLMRPEAKGFVAQLLQEQWPDKYTKTQITDDLNRLLLLSGFSDALSPSGPAPTQAEICRANCRWLAEAFPGLLFDPAHGATEFLRK